MYRAYVLRQENAGNQYVLDLIRPEEAIYNAIFGVGTHEFPYTEYNSLNTRIMEVLETLTDTEKQIILYRFGFMGDWYSLRSTGTEFNLTGERIRQIELKALRKLRHPSRARKLKSSTYKIPLFKDEHDINYRTLIIREIEEYLSNYNKGNSTFWEAILERNNIVISVMTNNSTDSISISELELSVHTYNILKRAGINTLADWFARTENPEDVLKIRNLGRKSLEEIVAKLNELSGSMTNTRIPIKNTTDKFISLNILYSGQSQIYKFKNMTTSELAECVYETLATEYSVYGSILNYNLSTGLLTLLLLKGYFYVETIISAYNNISDELEQGGFGKYIAELDEFVNRFTDYLENQQHCSVKLIYLDTNVARKIIEVKPKNYQEMLACCNVSNCKNSEEYKNIISKTFGIVYNFVIADRLSGKGICQDAYEDEDSDIIASVGEDYGYLDETN